MQYLPRKQRQDISKTQQGFSVLGILLLIIVVALIASSGIYVWHQHQNSKPTTRTTTASTIGSKSGSSSSTSTKTTPDPYAGWKTYCDSTYHYCFRYPGDWTLSGTTPASTPGSEGGISLLSPDGTVQITYGNAFVKDSNTVSFIPSLISKLSAANQDVTLVGGYTPTSGDNGLAGNNIPVYEVVDSSFLSTYPLTVGHAGGFPNNPAFSDQYSADVDYNGSLISRPAVPINTVAQSQTWLTSPAAKTSVQILESLTYNNN